MTIPDPPAGARYLTGPLPDPPRRGWWLDPEDPALMRYHTGKRWTKETTASTEVVTEFPQYQGAFPLGAGKDGLPSGQPLRPASGGYSSSASIWALCGAFTLGAVFSVIGQPALGAPLMLASVGCLVIVGWRAGYRPPYAMLQGTTTDQKAYALAMLGLSLAVVLVPYVAPAFDRESAAYEWTNRAGIFILYIVLIPFLGVCLYLAFRKIDNSGWTPGQPLKEEWTVGERFMMIVGGVVPLTILTFVLWERIREALWLG
jgi:hypothetical protein